VGYHTAFGRRLFGRRTRSPQPPRHKFKKIKTTRRRRSGLSLTRSSRATRREAQASYLSTSVALARDFPIRTCARQAILPARLPEGERGGGWSLPSSIGRGVKSPEICSLADRVEPSRSAKEVESRFFTPLLVGYPSYRCGKTSPPRNAGDGLQEKHPTMAKRRQGKERLGSKAVRRVLGNPKARSQLDLCSTFTFGNLIFSD